MNMIKKIALTASALLFLLAQIFSFYIIYENQQEKIELIKEKESKILRLSTKKIEIGVRDYIKEKKIDDKLLINFFRENMLEDSALYKNGISLFNGTNYEFENSFTKSKSEYTDINKYWIEKKLAEKRILVSYYVLSELEEEYVIYHVLDITSMYVSSQKLMIREIMISFFMSVGMAVLLVLRIKKITKPLEDTNESQRQLIGSISHELKTPLTAIQGYSETLLSVKLTLEQRQKALSYIYSESGRLSRLSEKMMELTRLYEPECKILLKKTQVKTLFDDVKRSVEHELEDKEITLITEVIPEALVQELDYDLMASYLINLINNSIMVSKKGKIIKLKADIRGISVEDEGCGISNKDVVKVRKAFYRVDKSRSRKSGNMGLGLSICDQIAKVHHASMVIESQEGKGTKISFLYNMITDR